MWLFKFPSQIETKKQKFNYFFKVYCKHKAFCYLGQYVVKLYKRTTNRYVIYILDMLSSFLGYMNYEKQQEYLRKEQERNERRKITLAKHMLFLDREIDSINRCAPTLENIKRKAFLTEDKERLTNHPEDWLGY